MRICAISDTHTKHGKIKLPEADVLIHAGDFTFRGEYHEVYNFANWFKAQSHAHKICIAGNHELSFQNRDRDIVVNLIRESGAIYLENNGCEINGIKFYGSPHTPNYHNWAFNLPRNGQELYDNWNKIPDDTNVLITHGPPNGILDGVREPSRPPQGCEMLKKRLFQSFYQLPNLKAHIFGHLHMQGGQTMDISGIKFVNAAICNDEYNPCRLPIIIDI